MKKVNILREINEFKNQLAYSKRIGFFLGSGISVPLGLPTVMELTDLVEISLNEELLKIFKQVKSDIESTFSEKPITIEDILNQLRRIRDITNNQPNKNYQGVSGDEAAILDKAICHSIYEIISKKEAKADLSKTIKFLTWYCSQNRSYPKEIFTTNYDLILEKSLESIQIPFFDGFVGSYEPFFLQEGIDTFVNRTDDITHSWLRLWKIHGSLGWFWKESVPLGTHQIIRIGRINEIKNLENELVIYPSKEKYDSSRKMPFVAYFDRLKKYLLQGELLFITSGFSFSDQHINELIFSSNRQNHRLALIIFFFADNEVEKLLEVIPPYLNLRVFGPTKGIIGGEIVEWESNEDELKGQKNSEYFWDIENNKLKLGNFSCLVDFFLSMAGKEKDNQEEEND